MQLGVISEHIDIRVEWPDMQERHTGNSQLLHWDHLGANTNHTEIVQKSRSAKFACFSQLCHKKLPGGAASRAVLYKIREGD